jgi:hypothetical protein
MLWTARGVIAAVADSEQIADYLRRGSLLAGATMGAK